MPMSNARLESLIWILIFGGGLLGSLGVFLLGASRAVGGVAIGAGALAVVLGVVLIWVRSRRPDGP